MRFQWITSSAPLSARDVSPPIVYGWFGLPVRGGSLGKWWHRPRHTMCVRPKGRHRHVSFWYAPPHLQRTAFDLYA